MRCSVESGHMELVGVRRGDRDVSASAVPQHGADAIVLDSCSVHELLQLQNCCHSLSQIISRRIAQMPGVMLGAPTDAGPSGQMALTSTSLEAYSNESLRNGHRQGWRSLPSHLEGDLGLWQAVQQELFPKPLKTRGFTDSREDSHCVTSPGMLSVATAPSDGGTSKGQRVCSRASQRMQMSHADALSQAAQSSAAQNTRCSNCSLLRDKSDDLPTPVSSICGDGSTAEHPTDPANGRHGRCPLGTGSSIPVCNPVTPIPECNSSLETAGSTGYNASMGAAQPQSGRRCGSAFTSSADAPVLSFRNITADTTAVDVSEGSLQTGTGGGSTQLSGSFSSTSPSSDRRRQKKRHSITPPVQYGFPTSPHHQSASVSSGSAPGSVHADEQHKGGERIGLEGLLADKAHDKGKRPASAAGPRVPTGLLSASLGQAKSAGTSPHARGASSMRRGCGRSPGSSRHAGRGVTCSVPISGLDQRHAADMPQRASAPHSATGSSSGAAASVCSPAIPQVLMAEMACMGFHRPLRVGSKQALSQCGSQSDQA